MTRPIESLALKLVDDLLAQLDREGCWEWQHVSALERELREIRAAIVADTGQPTERDGKPAMTLVKTGPHPWSVEYRNAAGGLS